MNKDTRARVALDRRESWADTLFMSQSEVLTELEATVSQAFTEYSITNARMLSRAYQRKVAIHGTH